jgi:hypothetical protein
MGPNVQPIFEVEFGREAIISIGLYANPLPTNDQVIFLIRNIIFQKVPNQFRQIF